MKINIIGPSCVGKTTLAKLVSAKSGWNHFDLDLVFIDRDYLAQTKIFRFRERADYQKRIQKILSTNNDWVVEGIYAVEKILKEADKIIFINLPINVPLKWQWKRYLTDKSQRSTYGLLNNIGLTKEIMVQYLEQYDENNFKKETVNYLRKYNKLLKNYENKLVTITTKNELEKYRKNTKLIHFDFLIRS